MDKETRQKSQILASYKNYEDYAAMTDNQGMWDGGHSEYPKNGTWGRYVLKGMDWLGLTSVGSGPSWHGATKTITLPADSSGQTGASSFLAQTRIAAETGWFLKPEPCRWLLEMPVASIWLPCIS